MIEKYGEVVAVQKPIPPIEDLMGEPVDVDADGVAGIGGLEAAKGGTINTDDVILLLFRITKLFLQVECLECFVSVIP